MKTESLRSHQRMIQPSSTEQKDAQGTPSRRISWNDTSTPIVEEEGNSSVITNPQPSQLSLVDAEMLPLDRGSPTSTSSNEVKLNVPPLMTPQPKLRGTREVPLTQLPKLVPHKLSELSTSSRPDDGATIVTNGLIRRQSTGGITAAGPSGTMHRRSESDRISGPPSGMRRRSIFGQYFSNHPHQERRGTDSTRKNSFSAPSNLPPTHPGPGQRKRSSSMSILESSPSFSDTKDYRFYGLPKAYDSPIARRFSSVEKVPEEQLQCLPPLPAPLRRLCSDDSSVSRSLHGQYPLVQPVPVLRHSSYRSVPATSSSSPLIAPKSDTEQLLNSIPSFNLTQSIRLPHGKHFEATSAENSLEATSNSSSSTPDTLSIIGNRNVKFDPRVTVCEFDDRAPRAWYNEYELEDLKYETILLAQEYLVAHPHEAIKYNRSKFDPITGTMRKKALFSLPVLSSTLDGSETLPATNGPDYIVLVESQVKNILVVDPNPQILSLFCRSMKQMFPKATLTTSTCGKDALQLVTEKLQHGTLGQHRNFDIIIVEQRLYQQPGATADPQTEASTTSDGTTKDPNFVPISKNKSFQGEMTSTSSSFSSQKKPVLRSMPRSFDDEKLLGDDSSCTMFGSDFIQTVMEQEQQVFSEEANQLGINSDSPHIEVASILSANPQLRALIIGVSAQPDRDAKMLRESGADVIWGKPIPRVGEALRNQLLRALIGKRYRTTCTSHEQ